ncbi:hypothetical protein MHBO_003989 [Bonamia ostreae]|uniref:Uncharacterized protein n=1 Tax=Bonamia ostreae TaxID=126728 RepID=A0ABV2AS26_9EUKA
MVEKTISFKNYVPSKESLREDENGSKAKTVLSTETVEIPQKNKIENFEDLFRTAEEESENIRIVPKKANWDLKEELLEQFEELENRSNLILEELRGFDIIVCL